MERQIVEVESEDIGNGIIRPVSVCWPDGRKWKIKRTLHVGAPSGDEYEGIRYTVLIGSVERYIYRTGTSWYVEPVHMEVDAS